MSEYQYVVFRAIDRPVSEKNLEYVRQQSTRAEITPWSFENEYHYGDFHGDAVEMLRCGYDIHLHYANFGIRKLMIRLPHGMPDAAVAKLYLGNKSLQVIKDRGGTGAILVIEPFHEPGDLEDIWELAPMVERLIPLRAEILEGDLRPLYLAHLAVACDSEHDPEQTTEALVPAGLADLSDAQRSLAELYGLSDELIAAAAQESPPTPARADPSALHARWLRDQKVATKDSWLAAWMADATSSMRAEMLAKYKADCGVAIWPTAHPNRTMAQLQTIAEEIADKAQKRAAVDESRRRAKRLAEITANPAAVLRETEKLVSERTTSAYQRVVDLLVDLREALSDGKQSGLAEEQAQKLKAANPTLRRLISELRRHGFLAK